MNLAELVQRAQAGTLAGPTAASQTLDAPGPVSNAPGPGAIVHVQQTELITTRELASLAGKLARAKSADKQELGRALLRVIKGEVWAAQGNRNQTAYKLSAEIIEAYPNCDPLTVVTCFEAAISNAQSHGSKMTPEKWLGMLERVQGERQNRLNMLASMGNLVSLIDLSQPLPSWSGPDAGTPEAAPRDPRAAELNAAGYHTLIVRANSDYYLRTPDRGTYDWKLSNEIDLRTQLARLFGSDNSTVITHVKGEFIGAPKLCEVYATVAARTIHDYSSPATTYDVQSSSLSVGLPLDPPAGTPDVAVHRWLTELAGGTERDTVELYDWISATKREWIGRPCAALVMVGAKDAGKTLFVQALARTWGVLPVKLANAVERFNGALLTSPFWHADERMPEEMTDAIFRETVQERSRLIEPKGKEKVELRGCGRLIFTLNDAGDLRIGGVSGADAIDAVAGRIAFFDCSERRVEIANAQAALRLENYDLDMGRIVGHLRWIQDTYQPRPQRFLGARQDTAAARRAVLEQTVRGHEVTLDAIVDYLLETQAWESRYSATGGTFVQPGVSFPLVTHAHRLYVWTSELGAKLGVRASDVERALRPFLKDSVRLRFGAVRARYRLVDVERILEARGVSDYSGVVQALVTGTRERLGLTGS